MTPLSFDHSRCIGQSFQSWTGPQSHPFTVPVLFKACNDCRRRSPGHPERQVYMAPAIDGDGNCENRIAPE